MTCNECGAENRDAAKFCANCGVELERALQADHLRPCSECGFANTREAKFCANCGAHIQRRHERPQQRSAAHARHKEADRRVDTKRRWYPAVVGFIMLAATIFVVVGILEIGGQQKLQPEPRRVELTSGDPALEGKVQDIAAKFICSCGTCGEEPLETCRCNTAIQERQFIRTSLQAGKSPQEIVAAVNKEFGWMKPEFAAMEDSTARRGPVSGNLKIPTQNTFGFQLLQATSATSKSATVGDRVEIFSHFTCPCGLCGIDELKDCSCNHPRGATEVKSFVDQKIAENRYTIAQVLEQVAQRYGGRKF